MGASTTEPRVATQRSPYSVHPAVDYARTVVRNIPDKTGRTVEQWTRLVEKARIPADVKARRAWFKNEHGLGMTTAWLLTDCSLGRGEADMDPQAYLASAPGLIEAMYGGPKAGLRPLHDALVALARGLGDDVRLCPCKTILPVYRNRVVAEIKPATRTRIDFGLALKGSRTKPIQRLVPTGGEKRGDRITHAFKLTSVDEVDAQVERWLAIAYALDA